MEGRLWSLYRVLALALSHRFVASGRCLCRRRGGSPVSFRPAKAIWRALRGGPFSQAAPPRGADNQCVLVEAARSNASGEAAK
jgi:hypothetical protein